jgi:hypothetical protein
MTDPRQVLGELVRVLRPGGMLLITNRISTRLMPGKTWSRDHLHDMLRSFSIENIVFESWQVDYDQVWGLKSGDTPFTGARPLGEVLHCPRCKENKMVRQGDGWVCERCKGAARIGRDGVIELFRVQAAD